MVISVSAQTRHHFKMHSDINVAVRLLQSGIIVDPQYK